MTFTDLAPTLLERYADRLVEDPETGCINWTGQVVNWGYGRVTIDRKVYAVHRVFYEIFKGPIPEGMQVDHICRNRLCQNPDHLQAVTKSENVALGHLRNTHCPKGHPYEDGNIIFDNGARRCRTCNREKCRNRYWLRRAAQHG